MEGGVQSNENFEKLELGLAGDRQDTPSFVTCQNFDRHLGAMTEPFTSEAPQPRWQKKPPEVLRKEHRNPVHLWLGYFHEEGFANNSCGAYTRNLVNIVLLAHLAPGYVDHASHDYRGHKDHDLYLYRGLHHLGGIRGRGHDKSPYGIPARHDTYRAHCRSAGGPCILQAWDYGVGR